MFALAATLVLAACGSGSGSGGASDPAAAVPPSVAFYLEVVLRPQGDAREGALDAAGKILHTSDPAARIRSLIQQVAASDGTKVDFAKDIEPWLGDRAGVWFAPPARAGGAPGFAIAIAVRDADQARKSIEALEARRGTKLAPRKAGSHDYGVASDGTAVAVDGDYALIGTEGEVRRGLATLDGDAGGKGAAKNLAEQDGYRRAIEPLDDNRLAHYYLDLKTLVDAALRADPTAAGELGPFQGLLTGTLAGNPQVGSFSADGDRLTIESVTRSGGVLGRLLSLPGLGSSPLLEQLPGDAWGAAAVPRLGDTLRRLFTTFAGVFGGPAITQQLRQQYGIDLDQDVFGWMGDAGLFARGTTKSSVGGGLVIQVTDEAKAAAAFGKLIGLARTRGHVDPRPIRIPGADTAFAIAAPHGVGGPIIGGSPNSSSGSGSSTGASARGSREGASAAGTSSRDDPSAASASSRDNSSAAGTSVRASTSVLVAAPGQGDMPIVFARGNGRVVIAFGKAAAAAALSSDSTFGDSDAMSQARDALGGKADPAFVVALAPVLALAESSGSASDQGFQQSKPYLDAFDVVAGGSRKDGDTLRSRLVAGLR